MNTWSPDGTGAAPNHKVMVCIKMHGRHAGRYAVIDKNGGSIDDIATSSKWWHAGRRFPLGGTERIVTMPGRWFAHALRAAHAAGVVQQPEAAFSSSVNSQGSSLIWWRTSS